ncbi:UDP-N-acetylmuramoyl-L-alanine--D-glutamate ligase [Corynebacterium massiliense]|mgnify:CR=1 FL=1|uniref:UDP-N-acetylmuramoyl-L-alanine--D-glutamate ligase n=1 Tax=Corynebacterium massiliense TaxID=441501 RepID=UPI002355AD7F|nr:UDP-N-acetylmuramoyl-L-alanine--D-glutamate ligase [Corynebacterium massiliense]
MDTATAPSATTRGLAGQHVVVTGAGVSGRGCVRTLVALGAAVTVVDANEENLARALSECPDAKGMTSDAALGNVRDGTLRPDFVVTSPGWRPDSPVLVAFQQHGIEVIGDVELAWRLDRAGRFGSPRTWLAVTGTNGKTTTTGMLAEIMQADAQATGRRAEPAGNIGRSVFELLADSDRVDVLVVELSSFQLHWSTTLAPHVGVLLNVAGDHLDWHGSLESYAAAKGKILSGEVAVLGRDDAAVVQQADRLRATGKLAETAFAFTLGAPEHGEVGVERGRLVDNGVAGEVADLGPATGIEPPGTAGLYDAAAAATAARAAGASARAVAAGLAAYSVDGHRGAVVARDGGVTYIDNSKATNPHAADAALSAADSVVWIAGGQLKGADVHEVIAKHGDRLRAVVLVGQDRNILAAALAENAPTVPVESIANTDPHGAMEEVAAAARRHAVAGDTVLLAPAAASLDMYSGMAQRGDMFAAAVARTCASQNS